MIGNAASNIEIRAGQTIPHRFLHSNDSGQKTEQRFNTDVIEMQIARRGPQVAPHSHPDSTQILVISSGGCQVTLDGRSFSIAAPGLAILPAHCVHAFAYDPDTTGWVVNLSSSYLQGLVSRAAEFGRIPQTAGVLGIAAGEDCNLFSAAQRLQRAMGCNELGARVAREAHLLVVLVEVLRSLEASDAAALCPPPAASSLLERFLAAVEQHYAQGWTIEKYCSVLGASKRVLRATCHAHTGQPPLNLVHRRIMVEAKRYLHYTALPVSEIAYRLGFIDQSYFTRFFKRHHGLAPASFRRQPNDLPALPSSNLDRHVVHF